MLAKYINVLIKHFILISLIPYLNLELLNTFIIWIISKCSLISKVPDICCSIPTNCASQSILISIFRMLYFKWAVLRPLTLRQFTFLFPWDIISINLLFMTWFTKMCWSPTKPLSNWATESALKLYEICTVLRTILNSCANTNCRTFTTYELFRFVILTFLLSLFTIFHTTKVRTFAFEALIIRKLIDCKGP